MTNDGLSVHLGLPTWDEYESVLVERNGEDRLEQELKALRATRATFESLFHDEQHAAMVSRGVGQQHH